MKLIVLLRMCVFLTVIFQVHANEESLDEDQKACIEETKIERSFVIEVDESHTIPTDPLYKEFLSCCWKRYGYQRENGEIDWDNIRTILSKAYHKASAVERLIIECEEEKGETDGDMVVLVLSCLDDHAASLKSLHSYYAGHHH